MSVLRALVPNKCFGFKCEIKDTCLRYLAIPSSRSQGYLTPRHDHSGKCIDEWKITEMQKAEIEKIRKK